MHLINIKQVNDAWECMGMCNKTKKSHSWDVLVNKKIYLLSSVVTRSLYIQESAGLEFQSLLVISYLKYRKDNVKSEYFGSSI